ncbi:MAG: hypothetical protein ACI86L_000042, partial [Dokdonia sp.]
NHRSFNGGNKWSKEVKITSYKTTFKTLFSFHSNHVLLCCLKSI